MTCTKHLSAFVSNFKAIRVVLRKLCLKNRDDPHSKSAHFMWFTQTETELIHVYTYVLCIQKPFPLVHYTINKQRRCHFCFLSSYLVIYKKFFFKIWRKWLLKFHEIFGLILFCWPYFSFLNAYSCVFRQNNASKFYFTFLSYHIFAYFFKIQGIKRWHILLNNWQILISETSVKSLNYLDSVGIKKRLVSHKVILYRASPFENLWIEISIN